MELILVLNCGSSSVKYTLFDLTEEREVAGGAVTRIGEAGPQLTYDWGGEAMKRPVQAADQMQQGGFART